MVFGSNRQVFIGEEVFEPAASQKLINHSPDGFDWGYGGSGPAQLALALLLHFSTRKTLKDRRQFALAHYQDFKWEIVAKLPHEYFEMEDKTITDWIKKIEQVEGK